MSASKPILVDMWKSFADKYHIEYSNVRTLENGEVLQVDIDQSSATAVFDHPGDMEKALSSRGMKQLTEPQETAELGIQRLRIGRL